MMNVSESTRTKQVFDPLRGEVVEWGLLRGNTCHLGVNSGVSHSMSQDSADIGTASYLRGYLLEKAVLPRLYSEGHKKKAGS